MYIIINVWRQLFERNYFPLFVDSKYKTPVHFNFLCVWIPPILEKQKSKTEMTLFYQFKGRSHF